MSLSMDKRSWAGGGPFTIVMGMLGILLLAGPVEAGSSRIALSVTGEGCDRQRVAMETALKQLPGVKTVDFRTVPDHVLIDVEEGLVTADHLAKIVNDITGQDNSCQAEAMQSCITADMPH